ncbi:ABC transporter ATP-binding protein [Alicyclobacillus herbarius]|uniref:ABC transporter ATP-binding protein n=1 Tax=Alicyclobacillus herbarius TaxID=122960 RepID=UPI0004277CD9|nr:ABC transporter ATP-binding protein [Alicyclobacillus herbarius]
MAGEFRRLSGFYRPYLRWLYLSMVLLVVTTVLGLVYPYLLKLIVNRVIIGHAYGQLPWLIAAILVAALVKGVFNFGQQYTGQVFGSRTAYDLRNALYHKLNRQPFGWYDEIHTGDLMSRLTADLDAFRMFLAFGINNLVNLGLIVGFGLVMMWWMNGWLALVMLCLMPILACAGVFFDRRLHKAFRRIRQSLGTLNSGVQETIMGIRTVKSFAKEDFEIDKFTERNDEYFNSNMGASNIWKWFFPVISSTGNLGMVLILLVGGWLVMHKQMELGDLVAFLSVLWYILWPLADLGFYLNNWTQARAAGGRLLEILEAQVTITTPAGARPQPLCGHVRFEHVEVHYGENRVLEDIDLEVAPGQTVALLGLTGAGKSTLVSLLPRFYDVSSGRVLIDGKDVREWDLHSLRKNVAVVFQEPFLFSTTIFSNIAYGRPDASLEEVRRAARLADAAEFIEQLPDGYATIVGERGMGLSGGQKQRIALARAILQDPSILILDDATSAVDMETEYQIQQALQEVMRGRTTFIIAHRISTLKRADLILVIDHGRIVERGTHDQLLAGKGLYRRIFDMQFRDSDSNLAAVAGGFPLRKEGHHA